MLGISGCDLKSFVSAATCVYGNEIADDEKMGLLFSFFCEGLSPARKLILLMVLTFISNSVCVVPSGHCITSESIFPEGTPVCRGTYMQLSYPCTGLFSSLIGPLGVYILTTAPSPSLFLPVPLRPIFTQSPSFPFSTSILR